MTGDKKSDPKKRSESTNTSELSEIGFGSFGSVSGHSGRFSRYFGWAHSDTPSQRRGLRYSDAGFTLMEMLVALGLFSVVVVAAADLFLSFQRISTKTENMEILTTNARFIMERIARETREGAIDYSKSPNQNNLNLLTKNNNAISFSYNGKTLLFDNEPLTGDDVLVREAKFDVTPSYDPFSFNQQIGDFNIDEQPRVTIFLSLDNNKPEGDRDYTRYDVQTTISSRAYRR